MNKINTGVANDLKHIVRDNLKTTDDTGSSAISTGVNISSGSKKIFNVSQKTTPVLINKTVSLSLNTGKTLRNFSSQFKNGDIKFTKAILSNFAKSNLKELKNNIQTNIKYNLKQLPKTSLNLTKTSLDVTSKIGTNTLTSSNDDLLKTSGYTIKTGSVAYKSISASSYNTQKIIKSNVVFLKKVKKTIQSNSFKQVLSKVSSSVVTSAMSLLKSSFTKILFPLIGIIVVVVLLMNILNSTVSFVSTIFSPVVSLFDGNELNETEWLVQNISQKRNDLINSVTSVFSENLKENGGNYDVVKFYDVFSESYIELSEDNIINSVYSTTEYLQYIQPIFHTILLSDYDLEPKEEDMLNVLNDIWSSLNTIRTVEIPLEYCESDTFENNGDRHANILTCPNHSTVFYHSTESSNQSFSCDTIYYKCNGHENNTSFHSGNLLYNCGNGSKIIYCHGYYVCFGHKTLSVEVDLKSFGELLDNYFLEDINELSEKTSLSSEEQKLLNDKKQYYEICLEYTSMLLDEFGYGSADIVELDDVVLTPLTSLACSFVGNPYVWGGNDPYFGIDCSAFVKYVYKDFNVELPRTSKEQVKIGVEISDFSKIKEGDLIFFSDDGTDKGVYHVAIYLGNNKIVHASNSKPYPRGGVKISYLSDTFYKIKRVIN